jgi:hypothetical protein
MNIAANAVEMMGYAKDDYTKMQLGVLGVLAAAQAFTTMPALQGLSQMFQAMDGITNPESGSQRATSFVKQQAASAVPLSSLQRQTERTLDPAMREAQGFLEYLQRNTPIAGELLYPQRDYRGRVVWNPPGILPNMVSPINLIQENMDELDKAMLDYGVPIPPVPYHLGGKREGPLTNPNDPMVGVELTGEQRDKWAIYRGEGIERDLQDAMKSRDFVRADKYGKRVLLQKVFADHSKEARDKLIDTDKSFAAKWDAMVERREAIFGPEESGPSSLGIGAP